MHLNSIQSTFEELRVEDNPKEEKKLEEIAYKLNANYTYICEQHGIALKKYEENKENRTFPNTTE